MKRKFDQVDNQTTNQAIKIHKKSEPMEELQSKLTEDPDFIYHIYDELTEALKDVFPFGASNTPDFFSLYLRTPNENIENLEFSSDLSMENRQKLLAMHSSVEVGEDDKPYSKAFIKGIGVCDHLNFFALMLLAKNYKFTARLETIYSLEAHTYVVIEDSEGKEYLIDLWHGFASENSDWH